MKSWEQRGEVWRNIAEEIADVKIMLGEMELLFDVEDAVEVCKKEKITRLTKRLKAAHAWERADICDVKGASYTRHSANQAKTGPWWTAEKDGRGMRGRRGRMSGDITKALLAGASISITPDCWPLRIKVKEICVSMTKPTWHGVVTLNLRISAEIPPEQLDGAIVSTIREMAEVIEGPHDWKG